MSSPDASRALVVERVFPHPPQRVWRALTDGSLLAQWLLNNDFEPVVGRRFQFRREPMPNWNGIIDCEVSVVEPLKELSYSWVAMGLETVVRWTLTPADGGTHLRMVQSGFGPDREANYKGAKYGWQSFFNALERTLASFE